MSNEPDSVEDVVAAGMDCCMVRRLFSKASNAVRNACKEDSTDSESIPSTCNSILTASLYLSATVTGGDVDEDGVCFESEDDDDEDDELDFCFGLGVAEGDMSVVVIFMRGPTCLTCVDDSAFSVDDEEEEEDEDEELGSLMLGIKVRMSTMGTPLLFLTRRQMLQVT